MRTQQLLIVLIALAFVAGACGNSATPSPTATAAASESTPASAAASAPATGVASPTTGASPTAAASPSVAGSSSPVPSETPAASVGSCTPEAPTALSANWIPLQGHDGDYSFKFPATWDKIYGSFVFTTSSLLDAKTFAETGLPSTNQTRADLVRTTGGGVPNASVLIVPGVVSPTAVVYQRQFERISAVANINIVHTGIQACIGGEPALGIEFTYKSSTTATTFQQSFWIVRNGRSYDFQWLAPSSLPQPEIPQEMIRTWQWAPNVPVATPRPSQSTEPLPSFTGSAFTTSGIAATVAANATAADPKTYVTTIAKGATALFAVFALRPGLFGQVDGQLKQGDKILLSLSLDYTKANTWGDFRLNAPNGMLVGSYTMSITFKPTGEKIELPFTVK